MAHPTDIDAAKLLRAFLRLTLDRIVPLTQKGVSSGSKLFGAAILTKDDKLDVVTVGTNTETESPLLVRSLWSLLNSQGGRRRRSRSFRRRAF